MTEPTPRTLCNKNGEKPTTSDFAELSSPATPTQDDYIGLIAHKTGRFWTPNWFEPAKPYAVVLSDTASWPDDFDEFLFATGNYELGGMYQ